MTVPRARTMDEVSTEVGRARHLWPSSALRLVVLVEEVGELAEAILLGDADAIRTEAIQVAACAVRIAEEGDATQYLGGRFAPLVAAVGSVARAYQEGHKPPLATVRDLATMMLKWGDATFTNATEKEARG